MFSWDLSTVQLVCLPLVAVLLWRIRLFGQRIPFFIVALGILLGLAIYFMSQPYVLLALGSHRVFVSELEGDTQGIAGFKLRNRLDLSLSHEGAARSRRLRAKFKDEQAVANWVRAQEGAVLISGNFRWLTVSFAARSNVSLNGAPLVARLQSVPDLTLVQSVPAIGISYEPRNETSAFLAMIFAADELYDAEPGSTQFGHAETLLRDAGSLVAPWSASFHRALPWFWLGNLYLKELLSGATYNPAIMECAIDAFQRAKRFVRAKDVVSVDLYAAILNNLGVALSLRSYFETGNWTTADAREVLRLARNARKSPNVYNVPLRPSQVAKVNLESIGLGKSKKSGSKRKGKKSRKPASQANAKQP
jgi:hypothetical protein